MSLGDNDDNNYNDDYEEQHKRHRERERKGHSSAPLQLHIPEAGPDGPAGAMSPGSLHRAVLNSLDDVESILHDPPAYPHQVVHKDGDEGRVDRKRGGSAGSAIRGIILSCLFPCSLFLFCHGVYG